MLQFLSMFALWIVLAGFLIGCTILVMGDARR
jgi:hypothetical protein